MKVEIEDLNADGRGRGYAGKRAVLVSQTLPGEVVGVRVDKKTGGTLQGRVGTLFESKIRQPHPCAHEFRCTGCHWLAMPVFEERRLKQNRIRAALCLDPDFPMEWHGPHADTPAGKDSVPKEEFCFFYRYYVKQVFGLARGRAFLGAYVAGTHEIVDNADCPILAPPLPDLMSEIVALVDEHTLPIHRGDTVGLRYVMARLSSTTGEMLLTLVSSDTPEHMRSGLVRVAEELRSRVPQLSGVFGLSNNSGGDVLLHGTPELLAGAPHITDTLLAYEHTLGPDSFFQVNPDAAVHIGRAVVTAATAPLEIEAAGDEMRTACVDAYCGVGAWTFPLSEKFSLVYAVDNAAMSVEALRSTATRYGRENIEVLLGDAADMVAPLLCDAERKVRVLVLDPPRKGVSAEFMEAIGHSALKRVVYVSCSTQSLARDFLKLQEHGFNVDKVSGIDQFSRTPHVETVVSFLR